MVGPEINLYSVHTISAMHPREKKWPIAYFFRKHVTMWCIQVSHDQFEGQCDAKLPLLAAVALKRAEKNSPSTEYNSWQVW